MFFGFLKSYKWENKNFTPSMKDTMIQSIENNSPVRCEKEKTNFRKPKNNSELKYWLENMVYYHHFTNYEIHEATGLSNDEILKALKNFHIDEQHQPKRPADAPLLLLPYPGGRHPRIGFLEGAIRPQRETKISVFTPWDPKSYVVVDIPEAIWSNLGLTYLAHTHVPTIWSQKNIELKKLEWTRKLNGELILERRLPNGIIFGTKVIPHKNNVEMEMWLKNATKDTLSGLRVQNCVMLKNAIDFNEQTDSNKVFDKPYAATRSKDGKRWIITAWKPCDRTWGNNLVPCMHSDPKFPDCPPGQTRRLKGWLSFYEGSDIETEFKRIDEAGWNNN
jgi:hypothetical protein